MGAPKSRWLLIGMALGCAVGFFAAKLKEPANAIPPSIHQETGSASRKEAVTVDLSPGDGPVIAKKDNPRQEAPSERMLRLPLSIVEKFSSKLLFVTSGELLPESLLAYGLTLDQVILLTKEINTAVRELKKLELENSELITTKEGDQYFQLRPFPKDGSSVRKQLMAILEQQLAGFSDDRIMLLRSAIDDSVAFKNFGRNSKQIWFEEVVNSNGTKEWQLHEKSVTDKMTVDRSSASKKLLDDLIQRHLPK